MLREHAAFDIVALLERAAPFHPWGPEMVDAIDIIQAAGALTSLAPYEPRARQSP